MEKCANCNAELNGKFCFQCGERKLDPEHRTVSHLFGELTKELTSVDGKLIFTLKSFFLKPGQQCRDFHLGKRKKYLSLFSLFFIFNLLFFISTPLSDFSLSLYEQRAQAHSPLINSVIDEYLKDNQLEFKDVAERYALVSATVAKSIIILSVPFLALFVWLINARRGYFIQDHIIFSLNIYCFVMIWPMFITTLFNSINRFFETALIPSGSLSLGLSVGLALFIWFSQKNCYQTSKLVTTLVTIPLFIAVLVSNLIYRYIQFWLTWIQVT